MPRAAKGHIEQLPSGSFRVSVYGGIDPLARQEIRLRSTVKDELQAQIEMGRLLKEASEGRTPETDATVARLMDEYAEWGVSTRQTNEGFIRRTIKPALGHLKVRKVRGPILDQLYTRLKRCGDLSCTGRPCPAAGPTTSDLETARDIDASGGDLGLRDGPAQTLKTFVWLR